MATSDNMATSELGENKEMSKEDELKEILSIMAEWYDKHESIFRLKVLYRDLINNLAALDRASKTNDLYNLLISVAVLKHSNLDVLYDTIKITDQYGIQSVIREKVPSFPNIRKRKLSKLIPPYRRKLIKFGNQLSPEDVVNISKLYNEPTDSEYKDGWEMILDLEHRLILTEAKMGEFITKLKTIEVPAAVKALTKGDDSSSDSVVFHLSVTDPNALENLWQISTSGELVRDLAELLVPEGMREDFVDKWTTEVDINQYESALKKLKTKDTNEPYDICIISDDTAWETKLKNDLKERRPNLNTTLMKKWRLRDPGGLQSLIRESKKVVVGFSAKQLTDYSKYAAHSVIVEMVEAKRLTDATLMTVKVSEDAVLPEQFTSFTAVNGWEDGFVDVVLQDFPEGSGESEDVPEGSGESKDVPEGSGESEDVPKGSGESEDFPEGSGESA